MRDLLRQARMQFVSLDRRADGRWEATFRGENQNDMRQFTHPDPAVALETVLTGKRPQPDDEVLV